MGGVIPDRISSGAAIRFVTAEIGIAEGAGKCLD